MFALACGGAPPTPTAPTPAAVEATEPRAAAPRPTPGPVIQRAALDAVLDRGLGNFLRFVLTEAHVEDGRFVGFRLLALRGVASQSALQPGDTIERINERPVERPEQAVAVWSALREAPELRIQYLRDGETKALRYPITE